jgi:hypothetical protein
MNERSEIGGKRKEQVADLELNRETIQDLTEETADQAKGGLASPTASESCKFWCGSRVDRQGCAE